jgi:hypothetical protein
MSTLRRAERLGREEIPCSLAGHPSPPAALPLGSLEVQLADLRNLAVASAKTQAKEALQEERDSAYKLPPEILGRHTRWSFGACFKHHGAYLFSTPIFKDEIFRCYTICSIVSNLLQFHSFCVRFVTMLLAALTVPPL